MECTQLSLFGKMYPELSVQTAEKILEPCWKNLPAWNNQTLLSLDLRGADGAKPELFVEADGAWLGDSSMLNIGELPSVARESLLSQTLEVNAPERYYLSARACQGILIRASRRGKPLPELLKTALLDMIEWWEPGTSVQIADLLQEMEQERLKQEKLEAAQERKEQITEHALKKLHKLLRSIAETGEWKQKYQGRFKQKKAAGIH